MSGADGRGFSGIWTGDFGRLWAAQSISAVGARISREGLPLTAVLVLHAGPIAIGRLAAAAAVPSLLVGLFAGGPIDRSRRRGILIGADLARAILLIAIPVAALAGSLTMLEIVIAAALVGGLGDLFDIADHAYLPSLIARKHLTAANARLSATESIAEIAGPALAGALISAFTAPIALAVNAATYLMSALFLSTIRARETPPSERPERLDFWSDLQTGLSTVWRHPVVRPLLLMTATATLFGSFFLALYLVFAIRTLGLTPAMVGITIAVGGVGALAGSALAGPLGLRLGAKRALIACGLLDALFAGFIPLAGGSRALAVAMLMIAQLFGDAFAVAAMIHAKTLRQQTLASEVMGRVGGVFAAAAGLATMAGALIGGLLGSSVGPRATLFIACAGLAAAPLWCVALPRRTG